MKNLNVLKFLNIALLLAGLSCGGGDADNPATSGRDELSPPLNLITVTGDKQIELRWNAQNYEKDLKGYDVFMMTGDIASITGSSLPGYPTGAKTNLANNASVPRCKSNNGFFAKFGVSVASEADCEDTGTSVDTTSSSAIQAPSSQLATLVTTSEASSIKSAKKDCYDPASPSTPWYDENLSLVKNPAAYRKGVGTMRCLISGLTNGTTYTFIVVAISGDSYDEVSWTSNLVEDTPAPAGFDASVTLESSKYHTLSISSTDLSVTLSNTSSTCTTAICGYNGSNTSTTTSAIFLARDSLGLYPSRHFVSATNALYLRRRGLVGTVDPLTEATVDKRAPGDQVNVSQTNDWSNSTNFPTFGGEVFDVKYVKSATETHYGKLVIGAISYADSANPGSATTTPVTLILQPKPGVGHYAW